MYLESCSYFLCTDYSDTRAADGRDYCEAHAHEVNAAAHLMAALAI